MLSPAASVLSHLPAPSLCLQTSDLRTLHPDSRGPGYLMSVCCHPLLPHLQPPKAGVKPGSPVSLCKPYPSSDRWDEDPGLCLGLRASMWSMQLVPGRLFIGCWAQGGTGRLSELEHWLLRACRLWRETEAQVSSGTLRGASIIAPWVRSIQPIPPPRGIQDVGRRFELDSGLAMDRPTKTTFTPVGLGTGTNV